MYSLALLPSLVTSRFTFSTQTITLLIDVHVWTCTH